MKKVSISFCLGITLLFVKQGYGQHSNGAYAPVSNNTIAPTAPVAYQFQKYGDVPVDMKTGIPQIALPVYTSQLRDLSWPISIRYNARGFRPSETATGLGLGWTMEAGIISSQVFGLSDLEHPYDYDSMVLRRDLNLASSTSGGYNCAYQNSTDIQSAETAIGVSKNYLPDLFNLSLPGFSAKFFIYNDTGYTIPASDLKINVNRIFSGSTFQKAIITVKDENGNRYYFSTRGYSKAFTACQSGKGSLNLSKSHIFYLDSARSLKGDLLRFVYHEETYEYYSTPAKNYNVNDAELAPCSNFSPGQYGATCDTRFDIKECGIDSIIASNGDVMLFKYSNRDDISGAKKLDSIFVKNEDQKKVFAFFTSYFGTSGNQNQRLKLDSVKVFDQSLTTQSEKFSFVYYTQEVLPPTTSFSVDSSGFYNGANNESLANPNDFERSQSLTYAKACIMEKMYYPTGGYTQFTYELNAEYGGLRLNKIEDYAHNTVIKTRRFEYVADPTYTKPGFEDARVTDYVYLIDPGETNQEEVAQCSYTRYSTGNFNDHSYPKASYFFQKVTEYSGDQGEFGKTEYFYVLPENYEYNVLPFEAILYKQNQYKYLSAGNWQKLQSEEYTYVPQIDTSAAIYYNVYSSPTDFKEKRLWGKIITKTRGEFTQQLMNATQCYPKQFTQLKFTLSSVPIYLASKVSKTFNYVGSGVDSLVSKELYFYQSKYHHKPTRISTINSKGDTLSRISIYAYDYAGGASFIDSLKKNNYLANAIESASMIKDQSGTEKITGGVMTEFNSSSLFYKFYKLEYPGLINLSNFKFSNATTDSLPHITTLQNYSKDSHYALKSTANAYTDGDITELYNQDNVTYSYNWETDHSQPVMMVQNADNANVAFTSFESNNKGGWSFSGSATFDATSPTGRNCYSLSGGNISKSGLSSSTTYIVSYWTKNGSAFSITGTISNYPIQGRTISGWNYFEHMITGQTTITISGSGFIDEVRLYPNKSLMNTYTYQPLTGMTSQCDVNSKISYYEYDAFGRLVLVRDQDKKIIKQICYNYAGQVENCATYKNVAVNANFVKNNCSAGYAGSTVTYSVPEDKYYSFTNRAEADSLAQREIKSNGQAYANSVGTCQYPYAQIEYSDYDEDMGTVTVTVWIRFYTDDTYTTPFSVSNVTVNYDKVKTLCSSSQITTHHTVTCNGTAQSLGSQIIQKTGTGPGCYTMQFVFTSGTGYQYQ